MMIGTGTKKARFKLTKKIVDIESSSGTDNSCEEPVHGKCSNACPDSGNHLISGIPKISDNKKNSGPEPSGRKSSIVGTKRKIAAPIKIQYEQEKRRKMDTSLQHVCKCIINNLMSHSDGWPFNHPVDPVALNIPDYYSVIDKPMDLGTIKSKLLEGVYSVVDEFAADVRLTFSNAVRYNPPTNYVNGMARTLSKIFETKWRCVLSKNFSNDSSMNDTYPPVEVENKKQFSGQKTLSNNRGMVKETDELCKFREELIELSKGKQSQRLYDFLKRGRMIIKNEDIYDMDVKSFDKKTLFELKQLVLSCRKAVLINSTCPKKVESCKPKVSKTDLLEELSVKNSGRIDHPLGSSDRKQICAAENGFYSCKGKPYPDSDGSGSMLDEETTCPASIPSVPMIKTSEERVNGYIPHDKAARIAMLKSRFADTILKAQQKILPYHSKNSAMELAKRKDGPGVAHCKAFIAPESTPIRVETQARNAPSEHSKREEEEKKRLCRAKQRDEARKALEKMERTVYMDDDNITVLKDLEMLLQSGCTKNNNSPLKRLGLFMREDYLEEIVEEKEEGEI